MRTAQTFRCALMLAWAGCWPASLAAQTQPAQAQVTQARDIKLVEGFMSCIGSGLHPMLS